MTAQHPAFTDVTQQTYTPKTLQKTDGTTVGDVVPFQAFDTGVTPTDRSSTIAANTSTQLMAANPRRRGFDFTPINGDAQLNKIGGAAGPTGGSIPIPQGTLYESPISGCSTSAIFVWSTVALTFTASEW